jgi:hypothetical protein
MKKVFTAFVIHQVVKGLLSPHSRQRRDDHRSEKSCASSPPPEIG